MFTKKRFNIVTTKGLEYCLQQRALILFTTKGFNIVYNKRAYKLQHEVFYAAQNERDQPRIQRGGSMSLAPPP